VKKSLALDENEKKLDISPIVAWAILIAETLHELPLQD
jgi:hypothetical protein